MKTKLSILLLITFFYSCNSQKKNKTDLNELNLNSNVKIIIENTYNAIQISTKIEKGTIIDEFGTFKNYKIKFNQLGNITEEYNDKYIGGLIIKSYSDNNKLIEYKHFYNDTLTNHFKYFYDNNGYLSKMEGYYFEKLRNIYKYINDNKGNVVQLTITDSDGDFDSKTENKFDEKNNKIESIRYNSDKSINFKAEYSYDNFSNITIERNYQYNESEIDEWTTTSRYDKFNNVIEELMNSRNNKVRKKVFKYKFDKFNNWIERVVIENDIPITITERDIEYYQ